MVGLARDGCFNLVGVGALNVDVVVDLAGSGWSLRNDEVAVDADDMGRLLARVASLPRRIALGGSAFNTLAAVARHRPRMRLGFVGVEGQVPFGAPSFRETLRGLRVDVAALGTDVGPAGVCLALEDGDTRSLRIAPGANTSMADHAAAEAVAAYLARARMVHMTSFLDERSPQTMADVLAGLRRRDTPPLVCLDPGHDWCTRADAAVRRLVAAADLVLVNEQEFDALGRAVDLGACAVVVKHPGFAMLHRDGGSERVDGPLPPLRTSEIRHPTGAGDAFAAGLLAALAGTPDARGRRAPTAGALAAATISGLAAARAHLKGAA